MSNPIENAAAAINRTRPVYEFELPEELADQDPYIKKSIGLVKLTNSEEIRAGERAGINISAMGYNTAKLSLWEVDGRVLNRGNGEDETVFERTDPAIRNLIMEAYGDISQTTVGATKKFLKSRKTKL